MLEHVLDFMCLSRKKACPYPSHNTLTNTPSWKFEILFDVAMLNWQDTSLTKDWCTPHGLYQSPTLVRPNCFEWCANQTVLPSGARVTPNSCVSPQLQYKTRGIIKPHASNSPPVSSLKVWGISDCLLMWSRASHAHFLDQVPLPHHLLHYLLPVSSFSLLQRVQVQPCILITPSIFCYGKLTSFSEQWSPRSES